MNDYDYALIAVGATPIAGYPGYGVDFEGRIWSSRRKTVSQLRPTPNREGYEVIHLNRHSFLVHRLVMTTFVGPRPPGQETRHLNGDKTDNRLVNLCYGTSQENTDDERRLGRLRPIEEAVKRRVIWLSDEDWSSLQLAAKSEADTVSGVIRRRSVRATSVIRPPEYRPVPKPGKSR
jgi:hypothetical protein